jgi:hypothetical protein
MAGKKKPKEDNSMGSIGRQRRRELASVLGHNTDKIPVWNQLLREVKELMKDSEDLKTARRILRL